MKLTVFLLTGAFLTANASGISQRVSFSGKDVPLEKLFTEVRKQTGFVFLYTSQMLRGTKPVTISVNNIPVQDFLSQVFTSQPVGFSIENQTVIISRKAVTPSGRQEERDIKNVSDDFLLVPIKGRISDMGGKPLEGVNVTIKGAKTGTISDINGSFTINASEGDILVFSSVAYETKEYRITSSVIASFDRQSSYSIAISLSIKTGELNETVVKGYYTTTKKNNTGSVGTVSAQTIANQPVTDPISAMQGRVSGVMISSSNGMPGSAFQVRVRGENSMTNGNTPLYVIDGVPFIFPAVTYLASSSLNQFSGANGDQSPLSSINPADIERIDVLKDADATAIYGSRGANGVILITTKKGKQGTSKVNLSVYSGISRIAHKLKMLNTQQYLELRNEAFTNDGATKTTTNAPDFLVWDQDHYTDWQDLLIGNTAKLTEATVSFSGGNDQTAFLLSATGRKEGTVLLGDFSYKRGSTLMNINHASKNGKFGMDASVKFATDKNDIVPTDVSQYFSLPPNYNPYNPDGSLYWFGSLQNPVAYLNRTYETWTNNLIANTNIRYTILPGLSVKANTGFTITNMRQLQTLPAKGFTNISPIPASQAQYAYTESKSYIIEPQIEYGRNVGPGKLNVLAGGTWQHTTMEGNYFNGTGFSSDALLKNMAAATLTLRNYTYVNYNYQAFFGRLGYDIGSKYFLNLTYRRDGSSRFGDGNKFGNFGAVGAAWVFTEESIVKDNLSFLSYGKLRGSYGVTGNDQIGDYQYLDTWSAPNSFPYGGVIGLAPERAFNPEFSWETNKKLEVALELGFLQDRIFLTSGYYRNRSGNQLINLTLSPQSGFSGYFSNSPALVQNKGFEFDLNTVNISSRHFTWKTSFNITLPDNKLLRYDNLEKSADATAYKIGESTRIIKGFQFTGIDPATGIPQFLDVNGDGVVNEANDWVILGETLPGFYGGLSNQFTYKNFSLDVFFQFVKQEAPTVDWGPLAGAYGGLSNKTTVVLDRWKKAGDITDVPRATVTTANPANVAFRSFYRTSSAVWGDASYIRLKNVSLKYNLSSLTRKWKLGDCSIYLQGQNLITITNYNGLDPEINGFDRRFVFPINPFGSIKTPAMPVLRTFTVGMNLSL